MSTEPKPQLISQRKSGGNQIILHKQSQKTAKTWKYKKISYSIIVLFNEADGHDTFWTHF